MSDKDKPFTKNERRLFKLFLLNYLHKFLCELFKNNIQCPQNNFLMECYTMDSKILQGLIQSIVATGEYTLEGIAYYTRIPFDVIFEAACGNSIQLSFTPWVRIVDLYMQVKPEAAKLFFAKLAEIKDKNHSTLSLIINECSINKKKRDSNPSSNIIDNIAANE